MRGAGQGRRLVCAAYPQSVLIADTRSWVHSILRPTAEFAAIDLRLFCLPADQADIAKAMPLRMRSLLLAEYIQEPQNLALDGNVPAD